MKDKDWNGIIWEGVYDTWKEARNISLGNGFSSDTWISTAVRKLNEYRNSCNIVSNPNPISNRFSSLPLIASSCTSSYDKKISILDFGGGVGTHFELLKQTLPNHKLIDYTVIETQETCEQARNLFSKEENIKFYCEFPSKDLSPHICYTNSVLQYIENWIEIIQEMIEMNPEYIILDDFPAGDNNEFITIQNYYSSKMPHRFFNLEKSIREIEQIGNYGLLYKSRYFGEVLGNFLPWPMNNFDKINRIDHSCSLVFRRGF